MMVPPTIGLRGGAVDHKGTGAGGGGGSKRARWGWVEGCGGNAPPPKKRPGAGGFTQSSPFGGQGMHHNAPPPTVGRSGGGPYTSPVRDMTVKFGGFELNQHQLPAAHRSNGGWRMPTD